MLAVYGQKGRYETEAKVDDMYKAACLSKLCTLYAVTTVVSWRNQ